MQNFRGDGMKTYKVEFYIETGQDEDAILEHLEVHIPFQVEGLEVSEVIK